MKVQIILGSTREGRFGEQPAQWILQETKKVPGLEVELIDLRDWPLPLFDEPVSPSFNKGEYKEPLAKKWAAKVAEADAYIIVTPEYNHGYSAVLKNAMDYVYYEWNKKPVAFVSYGGTAGGTRAVQQLRQVAIELQMAPIRAGVHFHMYWEHLDENGKLQTEGMAANVKTMLDQLVWWGNALKTAREQQ